MNRIHQYQRREDTDIDNVLDIDLEKIPSFIALIDLDTMEPDNLHDICTSIYRLKILQWKESLWQLYLQAGTGRLQPGLPNTIYWPNGLINTLLDQEEIIVNDDTCREYVQQQLDMCRQQRQQLQQRYNARKRWIHQLNQTLEDTIETMIDDNLQAFRLHYESHFRAIRHQYRLQVLEDQWIETEPSPSQRKFITDLLRTKTDYEKTREELKWIRQQQKSNQTQRASITLPILVQSLANAQLRQEFSRRQLELIEDYQLKMKNLSEKILSQHYRELKKKLDDLLVEYKHIQENIHGTLHLTPTMISTLDQMLMLISEKVVAVTQSKQQQATIELLFSQ